MRASSSPGLTDAPGFLRVNRAALHLSRDAFTRHGAHIVSREHAGGITTRHRSATPERNRSGMRAPTPPQWLTMRNFVASTAPWSAAILAFFVGAATAAGVVPVVLYKASEDFTAFLVVMSGLLTVPAGAGLGIGLKNRLSAW